VGDGLLVRYDGGLPICVLHREYRGLKHWAQRNGVLFPKYVQRCALRLDARGVPSAYPRNCLRIGELLGSSLQHCSPANRPTYLQPSYGDQSAVVHGRRRCLYLHDRNPADAIEKYGGTKLLKIRRATGHVGTLWAGIRCALYWEASLERSRSVQWCSSAL